MRFALLAVCLTGCLIESPSGDDQGYSSSGGGWGTGWGGGGGDLGYGCHQDADCGGTNVCARDGECLPATAVRFIHVNWTIHNVAASTESCARAPELAITFMDNSGDMFGFAPVPCNAGRYSVDKMPTRFSRVELARSGEYSGGDDGAFDGTGSVTLDLPY